MHSRVFHGLLVLACLLAARSAHANPANGVVAAGTASILNAGNTLTVTQSSPRAIIDWNSFDIAAGETTRFIQPSSRAIALNRIASSAQASFINGNLLANGQVIVVNPNGVVIGAAGNIDVAGFIATTADINNADFMTTPNILNFSRAGAQDGVVENQGHITIEGEGLGLLVAPVVRNSGVIEGRVARLQLAAGDVFGVDVYGDGLLQLAVKNNAKRRDLKAENTGNVVADAGHILMTAAAADKTVNAVINSSGVLEARGLVAKGGEIILTGANASVSVAGKVDASGKTGGGVIRIGTGKTGGVAQSVIIDNKTHMTADALETGDGGNIALWSQRHTQASGFFSARGGNMGGSGGTIETSSAGQLDIPSINVDTQAQAGQYGIWLLDPTVFVIGAAQAQGLDAAQSNVVLAGGAVLFDADINMAAKGVGLKVSATADRLTLSGHYIRTRGGDVSLAAKGTLQADGTTIYTQGGGVSLAGHAVVLDNAKIATGGGAYSVQATGGSAALSQSGAILDTNVTSSIADPLPPIQIVITADTQSKIYGTADPAFNYTVSGAFESGDGMSGALSRAAGETVGSYAVTLGTLGVDSASGYAYAITFRGDDFKIAPAMLTIATGDQSKTYGSAELQSGLNFSVKGLVAGDSVDGVTYEGAGVGGIAPVGDYALSLSNATGRGLSNYAISYVPAVLHVTPAPLQIAARGIFKTYGVSKVLDGAAFSVGTLYNNDRVDKVVLASAGADAAAQKGIYGISVAQATGTGLSNYVISYIDGTMTVLPAPLTVTALDQSKTYGDAAELGANAYRATGLVNGDSVSAVDFASEGVAPTATVGNYALVPSAVSGTGLGNYYIRYVAGALQVAPAALTVSAGNMAKTYGTAVNVTDAGFQVTGLKNADKVTDVSLQSAGGAATAAAGRYDIESSHAQGHGLFNYNIVYQPGKMTVNRAPLAIAARPISKIYGVGYIFGAGDYATSPLYNGDAVTHVNFASAGAKTSANVGDYAVVPSNADGTGLLNYAISYNSDILRVTPAALTIAALDTQKTYGDALSPKDIGFSTTRLYNGDTVAKIFIESAGMNAQAVAGDYALSPYDAMGTGLSNYNISYQDGTLHVLPAEIPIADSVPVPFFETQIPPIPAQAAPPLFHQNGSYYYASNPVTPDNHTVNLLLQTPAVLNALEPAAGTAGKTQAFNPVACTNAFLNGMPCLSR